MAAARKQNRGRRRSKPAVRYRRFLLLAAVQYRKRKLGETTAGARAVRSERQGDDVHRSRADLADIVGDKTNRLWVYWQCGSGARLWLHRRAARIARTLFAIDRGDRRGEKILVPLHGVAIDRSDIGVLRVKVANGPGANGKEVCSTGNHRRRGVSRSRKKDKWRFNLQGIPRYFGALCHFVDAQTNPVEHLIEWQSSSRASFQRALGHRLRTARFLPGPQCRVRR